MIELHGYWQRVGGIVPEGKGLQRATSEYRKGAVSRDSIVESEKELERYLAIPTFIRIGRKLVV